MKKYLIIIAVLISSIAFSQSQTTYKVTSIANMKTYSGVSSRVHVTATNEDFVNSPASTPDEVTIYDGAGSRVWKKVIDNSRQATLVSGTNIKTVNGTTLLGSGNLVVGGSNLYSDDGALDGARVVDLATFPLSVQENAANFLHIDPTANAENVLFRAINLTGAGNNAFVEGSTSGTSAQATFRADFNGTEIASIQGTANAGGSTLVHTSATHTFNIVTELRVNYGSEEYLLLDPVNGASSIRAFNDTDDDNVARVQAAAVDENAEFNMQARFNDGVKEAEITGFADATTSTITYTADFHIFTITGIPTFADDAAATGGGLTSGTLYKTTTTGSTFLKIVP